MTLCALSKADTAFVSIQSFELLTCNIASVFREQGTTQCKTELIKFILTKEPSNAFICPTCN